MSVSRQRRLVRLARYRSKKRGMACTITVEDIEWPTHCPALGVELNYETGTRGGDFSPSLDRIDSSLGYVPRNVRVISSRANRIKNNATPNELILIGTWALREENKR